MLHFIASSVVGVTLGTWIAALIITWVEARKEWSDAKRLGYGIVLTLFTFGLIFAFELL